MKNKHCLYIIVIFLLQCLYGFGADTIYSADKLFYLTETNHQAIYRRTFTADYILHKTTTGEVFPLSKNGAQECVGFLSKSRNIIFVRENNIFLRLENNDEIQITRDGERNRIINGKPDWVYEEEFNLRKAYALSPDGKIVAWIKFDESKVRTFSFPVYQGTNPAIAENALYPSNYEYKYPKAGEQNSKVSVWTYNLETNKTCRMDVPLDEDGYIPRILFTEHPDQLAIVTLNRHQNDMRLYIANPLTGRAEQRLNLTAKEYIDDQAYENIIFKDDKFVIQDDRDGFSHLYLYDISGRLLRQLTSGPYDVSAYYGTDGKCFYYASHEVSPLEQNIYKVDMKGKKTCLTPTKGWHNAYFSPDYKTFTDTYSSLNVRPTSAVYTNNGKKIDKHTSVAATMVEENPDSDLIVELVTFTTSEGVELNGWVVSPKDRTKQYPVIMYQYSGPGSQEVFNSWNNGFYYGLSWEKKMARKGYVMACFDGRGTGGRGSEFRKCTYLTMGDKESKDQVEAALWLGTLPYVDNSRIAIWGWSFGGFNTLLSMSEGRPVFNCGVAVAPVTDWRFYDSVYTERFMRTPQENPQGYDISPLKKHKQLHGYLLIMHGLADDNVHFQNTAEYQDVLVKDSVQFETHFYTNRNHSIRDKVARTHLINRMEKFFDSHLKP